MERAKQIARENEDVKIFIQTANDQEFFARFPAWFGSRKNFSYEKYRTGITERRVLAHGPYDSPIFTQRNAKRAYKIGMAKMQADLEAVRIRAKQNTEQQSTENNSSGNQQSTSDPYKIRDCMRCMLVERGTIFISDNILCSCKVRFNPTLIVQQEPEAADITEIDETDYLTTLAISTAICTTQDTSATQEDVSPAVLVKDKRIAERRIFKNTDTHKCKSKNIELDGPRSIILKQSQQETEQEEIETYALIYAPSGFGKTTLQSILMRKRIAIANTDDCPGATLERVKELLKTTSVITSRMDIANEYTGSKILFIPKNPETLQNRTNQFSLSADDYQYWYTEHQRMSTNHQSIICEIDGTFLSDWFHYSNLSYDDESFHTDMSDLERRIDYGEKYTQGTLVYERWKEIPNTRSYKEKTKTT